MVVYHAPPSSFAPLRPPGVVMKLLLSVLVLSAWVCAQTPVAPATKPVATEVGAKPTPAPEKKQEPKQEPKPKQEPGKQEPSKPDGTGKPGTGKPGTGKPGDGPATDEPRIDRPAKDAPVPRGTDPADIAAMRGAEKMLEAEKRLADQIKAGKITGLDKILPFDELTSWPYEDGLKGMPKRIKDLSGKKVLMTGFMLPIDEVQNIKEFLLVQSLWSCCYGQPPDIHGIVRVVMPKGKTTDYFFDPLKLIGTFKVEATVMDGYCVDVYQLHVESLEALR
ncbi:MAG: DUF3299 domain-containing protein [Planctomycetota bacterium]